MNNNPVKYPGCYFFISYPAKNTHIHFMGVEYMRDFKIFVAISDIHIGIKHITAQTFKEQLKLHFINVIKKFKYLDGIFITGDILHTILSLNSDYSEVYMWFIDQVYKIARKKKSTVIIVRGTQAHDNDQLMNIYSYINNDDDVDFRIYSTVEETTIWGDYKLLILPDVKVKQLKDIGKYLTSDKHYDMILGHGLINTMKFFVQESENMPTKTYEYDVDQLIDTSKGPVLFGHIHQFQCIRDHFYYVGTFTLLERGGIDAGFIVGGIYNKDHTKFKIEHYINPDSAQYYDLDISKPVIEKYPVDDIMEAIDEIIADAKSNDLITLRITRGDELESADKVVMLEARYRKDPRFSIVKKVKTKKEEESEKENKERKDKYSYLMDSNLDMTSIVYKYYLEDILPTLPDKNNPVAKLTEDDFRRILKE